MNNDFENRPSSEILSRLMQVVEKDFYISVPKIISKLLGLHLISSLLTLSLCQQFGLKWGFSFDLMPYLMFLGPHACQIFCGAFYLSSSFILIAYALPRHECSWLSKRAPLVVAFFTASSAIILNWMGSDFALFSVMLWALGAYVAGLLFFYMGRQLKYSSRILGT